jgi:hypothetical protein
MKNITVTVSDQAYRNARVWAAQHDASLSSIVQYLIATLPNISRAARQFPVPKTGSSGPEAPSSAPPAPEKTAPLTGKV